MANNKMAAKPMYKCGICDTTYDSIEERTACEQACLQKQKEEAKKAELERKTKEREARYEEVCAALDHDNKLKKAYLEDYGCFVYETDMNYVYENDFSDLVKKLWYKLP